MPQKLTLVCVNPCWQPIYLGARSCLCTSNDWQFWPVNTISEGILPFVAKKDHPKLDASKPLLGHNIAQSRKRAISTLPDNENTWEMDHFIHFYLSNFVHHIMGVLTVIIVSTDIFGFGAKMTPKHTYGCIYPSSQLNTW